MGTQTFLNRISTLALIASGIWKKIPNIEIIKYHFDFLQQYPFVPKDVLLSMCQAHWDDQSKLKIKDFYLREVLGSPFPFSIWLNDEEMNAWEEKTKELERALKQA